MLPAEAIESVLGNKQHQATDEQRKMVETIAANFYSRRTSRKVIVATAVAGAGKTATCLDLYNVLQAEGLAGQYVQFVAFNVAAKKELIERGVNAKHARTLNGLGHANLARFANGRGLTLEVSESKVNDLLRHCDTDLYSIGPARRFARKLVDFAKAECVREFSRERLEAIADHYEVFIDVGFDECEDKYDMSYDDLEAKAYAWACDVLKANNRVPESGKWTIDFNDQVYLPVMLKIKCFQNDMLVVDEAQDLSLANKHLVSACLKDNGVLVLVGDDYQCIYAWRGCEVNGLAKTLGRKRVAAMHVPLTYNWRSGREIIEFAQGICPEIQCGNGKSAVVEEVKAAEFDVTKIEGDVAVLSRLRAPLIGMAIERLKADKPFTMRLSLGFVTDTVKAIVGDNTDLSIRAFKRRMASWIDARRKLYESQDAESALEDLEDIAAILETLVGKLKVADKVADLVQLVKDLGKRITASDGSPHLSTIHGSKGLEWETTYVLGYAEIGKGARKDWKQVEARNLRFVAVTRAKDRLVFLNENEG